eukprot:NODE_13792_length_354_cov_1.960656_g12633_i0.p2 GENE.NODE_13792_length_354_cov_1.960656_g12633_i0~~NODE_13792_length_354_cov_1.960656_g12633_i0.p2  ORF type:complete len:57 (+),score=3.06 NODE_13792_length_354_cov_1.960656_g12633_i0:135-305(+)
MSSLVFISGMFSQKGCWNEGLMFLLLLSHLSSTSEPSLQGDSALLEVQALPAVGQF